MGMLTEGQILKAQRKTTKQAGRNDELLLAGVERTNALLTELLAEMKHANELTRWQIGAQKVAV